MTLTRPLPLDQAQKMITQKWYVTKVRKITKKLITQKILSKTEKNDYKKIISNCML
jgi:hypothetical protein